MSKTQNKLASYIDACRPIVYINHFDFNAVDTLIAQVVGDREVFEYNDAFGSVDFKWKYRQDYNIKKDLDCFLAYHYQNDDEAKDIEETFLILKDIHFHLDRPKTIALLKSIALKTLNAEQESFETVIIIVASKLVIPTELEHLITVFDFPSLQENEIEGIIKEFAEEQEFEIEDNVVKELAISCKGLSEFEIIQILYLAFQNSGFIDIDDKQIIIQEKEQIIKKTGALEIINFEESIDDIGGLEKLKEWLKRKAQIFKNLDKATEYGVDIPKGIMLLGMPGCGKSLVAKVTARLFEVPLLRLDIGKLLGRYVGESEENFRKAINVAEAVCPCILWVDEIEKAFAGIGESSGGGEVTTRLFGNFLTWLQEKENTVFVVATANDISKFPPEFLRKGRFDELFQVNLPTEAEQEKIFEIHLKKRGKLHQDINLKELVAKTSHSRFSYQYSGADIEAVVKETIENAFIEGKERITTKDIINVINKTIPLSESLSEQIKELEELLSKYNIKSAT
ncbi:MAG: AAA family ATPase [Cyanobacteria bacterium P01_G01_bin.39]